jgi:hypothetical protein
VFDTLTHSLILLHGATVDPPHRCEVEEEEEEKKKKEEVV